MSFFAVPMAFDARSLRFHALLIGVSVLSGVSGCGPTGDQTAIRRKEMEYTLENLTEEVAGRIKESDRRAALMNQKGGSDLPTPPQSEAGSDRSNGPGGNPFSIERIGADVAVKLTRLSDADPESALVELPGKLKTKGVEQEKIDLLVKAIGEHLDAQTEEASDASVDPQVGGR